MSSAWDPARTTRKQDGSPDAGIFDSSLAVPASYYPQTFGSEPYTRTTSATTANIPAGQDLLAPSIAVLVASAARQRPRVSSPANTQFSRPWSWLIRPIGTPFEIVAADIFGPLKPTARGHTHIIVIIGHHTRWVELIALPEPTAELVAEAIFEHWISRWGTMGAFLTDDGRQFTVRVLQQFTDVYGIKHIYSSPYKLRSNFVVESYMRTLKITLKLCTQAFRTNWDVTLQAAALAYRATPNTVTGHTPFFFVTGQEIVLPLSREWHEPASCLLGLTWLEALWRCRLEVIKARELAADENTRAQTSEISRLRPGNHAAC